MKNPANGRIPETFREAFTFEQGVTMAKRLVLVWKVLKQYLANSNIHGLRYFAEDGFSPIERIFWVAMCGLCWWGCTLIIMNVLINCIEHPVAVTAETMFFGWAATFPAVAVCHDTTFAMREKYFKKNPGSLKSVPLVTRNVPAEELLAAYDEMLLPCKDFIRNCTWNDEPFNCCEAFTMIPKTGVGPCVIFNSHIMGKLDDKSKFHIHADNRYADLTVEFIPNANYFMPKSTTIYILNSYQAPIVTTDLEMSSAKLKKGQVTRVYFTMQDMYNEDGVKGVPIKRRNCRFSDEVDKDSPFPVYSRDLCSLQVYIEKMIEYCGCVHFYYAAPEGVETCNMTSSQCLLEHADEIKSPYTVQKRCVPDCEGADLDLLYMSGLNIKDTDIIKLQVKMLSYPFVRYRRYVVHTLLDTIVAIGSAMGLFMGASVLSVCEILYWFFVRRDKIQ